MKTLGSRCSVVRVDGGFQIRWRSVAMTLPQACAHLKKKMAGEMEMMISLCNVLCIFSYKLYVFIFTRISVDRALSFH